MRVSNAGLKARLDALDAAIPVIKALPGEHVGVMSIIETAREMLICAADTRGAHVAFRDIKFELKLAGVQNPALIGMIDRARYAA